MTASNTVPIPGNQSPQGLGRNPILPGGQIAPGRYSTDPVAGEPVGIFPAAYRFYENFGELSPERRQLRNRQLNRINRQTANVGDFYSSEDFLSGAM
ncbi:MAG: hypothetical protein ACREVA_12985, partial [Burkholderiales bacterium]